MAEFERICGRGELPAEGRAKEYAVASGRPICLARIGGEVTAMDNECPHGGGPLGEGMIEGGRVVCPWHAWAFDVHTGEAEHDAGARVEVFPVKMDGDDVMVKV